MQTTRNSHGSKAQTGQQQLETLRQTKPSQTNGEQYDAVDDNQQQTSKTVLESDMRVM
jgi:hypothetical protein